MSSLNYINSKLYDAVYLLTIHEGDARTRLARAIPKLKILFPDEFPEDLRDDFRWVLKMIDKGLSYRKNIKGKDWPSPSKLKSISNSTASNVIKKIVYIQSRITDILNN